MQNIFAIAVDFVLGVTAASVGAGVVVGLKRPRAARALACYGAMGMGISYQQLPLYQPCLDMIHLTAWPALCCGLPGTARHSMPRRAMARRAAPQHAKATTPGSAISASRGIIKQLRRS